MYRVGAEQRPLDWGHILEGDQSQLLISNFRRNSRPLWPFSPSEGLPCLPCDTHWGASPRQPSPWCGRTVTWLSAPTAASPSPMGLSRVRSTSYTLRAPQPGPWWCPPTPNSRGMVLADQGIHQTCCSLGRGLCPGPDLRVCRGPRNQLQAGHPWRGDPWATLHASREMA